MEHITIKLADVPISILLANQCLKDRFKDYIVDEISKYTISISPARLISEQKELLSLYPNGTFPTEELEYNAIYREIAKLLWHEKIIVFHGAVIEFEGNGYIFSGPSGVGKTTHARLWQCKWGNAVTIVNGDRVLLRNDANGLWGYGSPWMGKERLGQNQKVKIKAICHLHQGIDNVITHCDNFGASLGWLLQQTLTPERESKIKEMIEWYNDASMKVDLFEMTANLDVSSVVVAYNCIKNI